MLDVIRVTKRFGNFLALDEVCLRVERGSIRALLGHNGAGKSTLINVIGGAFPPTAGQIQIDGRDAAFTRPRDAMRDGIAVIHQHLSLIETLSVADNIFLGDEATVSGVLRSAEQRTKARALLQQVGATCQPDDRVSSLGIAQRQLVEIAKALRRKARVLVLDEPTAALSDVESQRLTHLVLGLRDRGLAVIYVTHLLGEVERLADTITVLKDGRVTFDGPAAPLSREDLVRLISDEGSGTTKAELPGAVLGEEVLSVKSFTGSGFGPLDFAVRAGEIVGLFGMLGSGRGELLRAIAGARRPAGGSMSIRGVRRSFLSPRAAASYGVSYVGGDRAREGLFKAQDVSFNLLLPSIHRLSRWGVRCSRAESQAALQLSRWFAVRASAGAPIGSLSGGNQQKVVVGRAVSACDHPSLVVLDGPTQGVDVASRADIYASLRRKAADEHLGILFSTTDPDEALSFAHRILVMRDGHVVAELKACDTSEERLIYLASHGAA